MGTITDLIPNHGEFPALDGYWYATVTSPSPATVDDLLYVIIPDISPTEIFGPCRWDSSILPDIGDECLIIFDNRQQPWAVTVA